MDKMRWFIVGNLIGFAILVCGVAVNDSFRHKAEESKDDAKEAATTQPVGRAKSSSQAAAEESADATTRLVTTRDISKGTVLHAGDVELHQVQIKHASPDSFTDVETALGRKTRIDLVEGEMLQSVDLEKK